MKCNEEKQSCVSYPMSEEEVRKKIQMGFLTPKEFWATFLSCIDLRQTDGGRLTEVVQNKLRLLLMSQILRDAKDNILGTYQTLPMQFAGNTAWFVLSKTQARSYMMTFVTEEGCDNLSIDDVFILFQRRFIQASQLDLGYCFSGGLAKIIDRERFEKEKANGVMLAGQYDNVSPTRYQNEEFRLDPHQPNDAAGIKKNAAARNTFDKIKAILDANYAEEDWNNFGLTRIVTKMLPNDAPAGAFRIQQGTTNLIDPSRALTVACPTQKTIDALRDLLDSRVVEYWERKLKTTPPYFLNDFIGPDPSDPKRLKLPLSNTYMGYLHSSDIDTLLARTDKKGMVGADAYALVYQPVKRVLSPGLFLYPHEFYFSLLCNIGLRLSDENDFKSLICEAADIILQQMKERNFEHVLSAEKYAKIFALNDDEEIIRQLHCIAYFDFDFFQKSYLLRDDTLANHYMLTTKMFVDLKKTLAVKFYAAKSDILDAMQTLKEIRLYDFK